MRSPVFALCLAASATLAVAFAPAAPAFSPPALRVAPPSGVRGVACAAGRGGASAGGKAAAGAEPTPVLGRRVLLGAALGACAAAVLPGDAALAKKKKEGPAAEAAAKVPTISLADFYTALYAQEVESVEFDGPEFDRAYVKFSEGANKGKTLLIGEGYPKESPVNSSGPQQVLAKIRNEIKAGNPVTWSWKGAGQFKKKPAAEKSDKPAEGKDDKGEQKEGEKKGAEGKDGAKEGAKDDKKEDKKGGIFGLPFAPPKSL